MVELNVFFAYQFSNSSINAIERENIYTDALEKVNQALAQANSGISLQWEYWNIESGTSLSEEIFARMDNSDLFVFDLSDGNPNVFIELGYAIAQIRRSEKKMVVLTHDETPRSELPSDISGMFVLKVNDKNLRQKLTSEINSKAKTLVPTKRLIQSFWNPTEKGFDIVCPALPANRQSQHANPLEDNYLKYLSFADLDTLFYLQQKSAGHFPHIRTANYRSDRYEDDNPDTNVLIVGGPVWNNIARSVQASLPLQFLDGGDGFDDPVQNNLCSDTPQYRPKTYDNIISEDVSYFARVYRNDGTYSFLISGCRTYGVLGAAKAFLEDDVAAQNIQLIEDHCGNSDFVAAFYTRVLGNRPIPTRLNPANILSLCFRSENGDFVEVAF